MKRLLYRCNSRLTALEKQQNTKIIITIIYRNGKNYIINER